MDRAPGAAAPSADGLDTTLLNRLLAVFQAPDYRPPPLPEVALGVLQLSYKSDADIRSLVELVERDALLAGQVLRLARSGAYAARMPLQSLKEAVVRLGLGQLRAMVMEAALAVSVFPGGKDPLTMTRLQLHSTATGRIARRVCAHTPLNPEYAFLCGLLHDIGFAGILLVLDRLGMETTERARAWPTAVAIHERASAIICALWRLPDELLRAVGVHHQWNVEGTTEAMCAVLAIAESLATELGAGFVPSWMDGARGQFGEPIDPAAVTAAAELLELDAAAMAKLKEDARAAIADLVPAGAWRQVP